MRVVAVQDFDIVAATTYNFNGDSLGARGFELILGQINATQIIELRATVSTSVSSYLRCRPTSVNSDTQIHVTGPIQGNPIALIFSAASTSRGRFVLWDEPLRRTGRVPWFSEQAALGAGVAGSLRIAQAKVGRFASVDFILESNRAVALHGFLYYGITALNPLATTPILVTGAGGGFVSVNLPAPHEMELYLTNLDGANPATINWCVEGRYGPS